MGSLGFRGVIFRHEAGERVSRFENESFWRLCVIFASLSFLAFATGCLKTTTTSTSTNDTDLPECSLNSATSASCKVTTTGSIVTRTSGANITSWTNGTASTSVSASIPNGFYSGKTVTFTDALLLATNIKYGVTIFGVTGTDPGLASNAHREKATSQLTASGEAVTYAGIRLPTTGGYTYREIPLIAKDDDGSTGGNVTYVDRSSPVSWTGRTCGTSGTLTQRIADCAVTLGAAASWTGASVGNAGQATWRIVTRTGDCTTTTPSTLCREVWRDERTQLLWSSRVAESINWCMSTGSNNIAGNAYAEDDPNNYCDVGANQNTAGQAISACFEDGGVAFTNTDASINNANGKGSIGRSSTPAVAWRLPTIYDYEQANIDGIRYVMPDMGTNAPTLVTTYEWSATVLSSSRASAWIFDSYLGYLGTNTRSSLTYSGLSVGARCVGR